VNDTAGGRTDGSKAKIFISYRRRETAGHAGRLYDGLVEHFGADRVFMDVTMEPGVDFADQIRSAVGSCGALIALIGEEWLEVRDDHGNRRIDDPSDVHRLEIEAALDRNVRVIPALVQDAHLPSTEDLPAALQPLVRRQAVDLSDGRWDYDVGRLTVVLERVLADAAEAEQRPGRATPWRRRARRVAARARRLLARYPARIGFALGVLSTLVLGTAVLAATGYFDGPLLRVSSFEYVPPAPNDSIAQRCVVRAESDYRVRNARFVVDGNPSNVLDEQTSAPWECSNRGNENEWDTCEGHSRGFPLDPDRPHRLTVTITDTQGNTASRTRSVDTNCPPGQQEE
jgi:hypothetical protein